MSIKIKFCFQETADLSKAFLSLSRVLWVDVDLKILLAAQKIRNQKIKATYYSNLVAELNNHVFRRAKQFSEILASAFSLNGPLFQKEIQHELMNIIKIRLSTWSLNQKIKKSDLVRIFFAKKIREFSSVGTRKRRINKDRFFVGPILNLRVILNAIDHLESEEISKDFHAARKTRNFLILHLLAICVFRPKIKQEALKIFLQLMHDDPSLITWKPKIVRSICEAFYYQEFSEGNEPLATQVAQIADDCLNTCVKRDQSLSPDTKIFHPDFTKTIGYLANLLILSRIKPNSSQLILLGGENHSPGNSFLYEKIIASERIQKLPFLRSRRILKDFRPWPIVHHLSLDGKNYNWYEGLWIACKQQKFVPLKWEDHELQRVKTHLVELGKTNLGRFVTMHIRDKNYYKGEKHEKIFHGDRNATISNYEQMAKILLKKGYSIVLVGDNRANHLRIKHPGIFDYAHSERKTPILDIFFMTQCALFVGTNSGPFALPGLYGTPALITNFTPIGNTLGFPNYFYMPKKIWDKKQKAVIPFHRQLDAPLAYAQQIKSINPNYIYLENTANELAEAANWIDKFLSGKYLPSAAYKNYFENQKFKNFPRQISILESYFKQNSGYFKEID